MIKENKWISVNNRLPDLGTSVLCCVNNHVSRIVVTLSREQTTHDGIIEWLATFAFRPLEGEGDTIFPVVKDHMVTHWMPMPELPE